MTITVDISPEVQAELARQAASRGSAIEDYAASLLEGAVRLPAGQSTDAGERKHEGRKSLVEVCAMVKGMTEGLDFSRKPSTGRPIDLS